MPTPTVNERLQRLEDRQQAMLDLLNGSGDVGWDRSVRGRLHYLVSAERARELRATDVVRRFSRGQVVVGIILTVYLALLQTVTVWVLLNG